MTTEDKLDEVRTKLLRRFNVSYVFVDLIAEHLLHSSDGKGEVTKHWIDDAQRSLACELCPEMAGEAEERKGFERSYLILRETVEDFRRGLVDESEILSEAERRDYSDALEMAA